MDRTLTDGRTAYARLEIDLGAIVANWRTLKASHGGNPTAGVLKADAYGTGAIHVAPALLAAGCKHFFTAHLEEALAIRSLVPGAMLAVLNGPLPGSEAEYVAHGIHPVLGSPDDIARWSRQARTVGRPLPALVHIDTGMNRLGLTLADVTTLANDPWRLAGLQIDYWMTHLVAADAKTNPISLEQVRKFSAACAILPTARRSVANSCGIYLGDAFRSDLARPGAGLYGINPIDGEPNPMRPVARLLARVLQVREIAAGEAVGYNEAWRAVRPSRIGVVGVGYADGLPRALSNNGAASFDGRVVPLVGRVSMDLITFDITDNPRIVAGSWLELLGPDRPLAEVAGEGGISPYELLTHLGRRYARVWQA